MRTANDPGEDGLDDEAFTQLVVQFSIRGHGTVDDLDLRHQVEDILDQALRSARLGHVDGGDIGSGTINVFAIVEPSAWEQAWAVIRTELARRNLLERDRGPRCPRRRWRRMAGGYLAGGLRTPVQLLVNTTRIRLQEITAS